MTRAEKYQLLSAPGIVDMTEIVLSLSHLLIRVCSLAEMVLKSFLCAMLNR